MSPAATQRFHDLVLKHALGESSAQEDAKLQRYQALRRPHRTAEETHYEECLHWRVHQLLKHIRAATLGRAKDFRK